MIVNRKPLTFWEQLYLPAIVGGFKVTARHLFRSLFKGETITMEYPEQKWTVPPNYRGAPYLVRDQDGNTKCVSCQLCEFVCPPRAIKIVPPGPAGQLADRPNAEKIPKEFEINMLRCIFCGFCQEVCPEEAIFLMKDYSLTGQSREEMIYNKEKLLALGGTVSGVRKWKQKLEEAEEQEIFPVKV
jgi:NADH-quinone oxidoreductase subunit I